MSSEMDNALLALSLKDDDDAPFNLPDFPQFYATERNACSLIGRLLNPRFQNMANLILDMPRKWQKVNRVRGIALTKERFQFIFSHANDLQDVLDKGMQTHNDWGLAIERWVETPPPGYLQSVSIWVRISNIPVNHYTKPAITELGELIGHVEVVAFDPEKSQRQDYVRVKINIEVTKPLKKSRVLNLPGGGQTTIYYFYEKVQKRCTECQRLTHAKEHCPLLAYKQNMRAVEATKNRLSLLLLPTIPSSLKVILCLESYMRIKLVLILSPVVLALLRRFFKKCGIISLPQVKKRGMLGSRE